MPYIIRCTIGERRDPTRRPRLSPELRRDRGRFNIAGRRIKTHRPTHISDSFYEDNAEEIQLYIDAGFIVLQQLGAKPQAAVEEKPAPPPVAKPKVDPAPPAPEPKKEPEAALKEMPKPEAKKPEPSAPPKEEPKKAPAAEKAPAKKPAAKKPAAKKPASKKGGK